ncbi:MAG: haloacid dehalogenase-like hydrolase [archaeon]|nr:haloacid dehalogenase-like hydrolase [archaeon]
MNLPKVSVPKVKTIKAKLASAKLLGIVVKNSLQFKLRRQALRRFKATEFDTIVVDMDGTLYKSDANLEALKVFYPESENGIVKGEELYDSILSKIASGTYNVEQAIVEGNKLLMEKNIHKKDFPKVLEKLKPGLRKPLIRSLKKMKKAGKTLILATLSSREFGELLNKYLEKKFDFSFDILVGTQLEYDENGKITGVKSMVGTKDTEYEKIPVKSKLTAIRNALEEQGKKLDLQKSILITDSYSDIDLAKMFVTVLIQPTKSTTPQKVSQRLKLADYIFPEKYLQTNLESIILGPELE